MRADERREVILDVVRAHGPATVAELVERLGTSEATVRRDLLRLDGQGLLRRVHGGARPLEVRDGVYADLVDPAAGAKEAIARAFAQSVPDGASLLLDIGTTVARVAKHLRGRRVTVVTRNLAVYADLADDENVDLVLLGGTVRPHHRSLVGFLTEEALRQLRADVLLLGTSGIRRTGHSVDTVSSEVSVKRAMIAAADEVVLLADASKFPGVGTATVCGPEAVHRLVTDVAPDPVTSAALRASDVRLVLAPQD
jgi:DeoR/GlpR family transcriptional regulator of sugar metabolism